MLQTPLATQEPTSAMPTNSGITELLDKLREQRTKALAVLDSLLDAREACVTHGFVYERTDAVREVTGVSSIDKAIESTRRIIEAIDRQLASLAGPATA